MHIDPSLSNFTHAPNACVLRLKNNTLYAEKKGLWTWIKTLFDKRSYNLYTIVSTIDVKQCDDQFLQALATKITRYNEKHTENKILRSLFVKAVITQPTRHDLTPMQEVAENYAYPGMKKLLIQIGDRGFGMKEIQGDGHCCFRSFFAYLIDQKSGSIKSTIEEIHKGLHLEGDLAARMNTAYQKIIHATNYQNADVSTAFIQFLRIAAAMEVQNQLAFEQDYVLNMSQMDGKPERHGGSYEIEALCRLFGTTPSIIDFDRLAKPLGQTVTELKNAADNPERFQAAATALQNNAPLFGDVAALLKQKNPDLKKSQIILKRALLLNRAMKSFTEASSALGNSITADEKTELLLLLKTMQEQVETFRLTIPAAIKAQDVDNTIRTRIKEVSALPIQAGISTKNHFHKTLELLSQVSQEIKPDKTLLQDMTALEESMQLAQWQEPLDSLSNDKACFLFLGNGHYNLLLPKS